MRKVRVFTKPKKNTLDPQGNVVLKNLKKIGIKYIEDIKIGRYFELHVDETIHDNEIKTQVIIAAEKLLHNNIIEDYEIIY